MSKCSSKFASIKLWSLQNPFLSLKIQVSSEIIWFKMLCTYQFLKCLNDQQPVHFFSSGWSSLHKMVRYQPQVLLCCYMPQKCTWFAFFSNYLPSISHKHKWNTESLLTSHLDLYPCPVTLGHEPKWWHFDVLWQAIENQGFNQIKKFCGKLLHKSKFYCFSEKNLGG